MAFSEMSGKFCTLFFILLADLVMLGILLGSHASTVPTCSSLDRYSFLEPGLCAVLHKHCMHILSRTPGSTHKPRETETNDPIRLRTAKLGCYSGGRSGKIKSSRLFWFAFCC